LLLGFISSFKFIPYKNRILSLVYFSNGAVTYYLTSEFHFLFSFIYFNKFKKLKKIKLKNTALMLFQIKKLSFVSCLEILPNRGAQYCRSSGTKSKIFKIDHVAHSVLIQLPSGVKKTFSYYSFVLLGQISVVEHARYKNHKSGY
jgi:ribosomal protein L2